MEIDSVPEELDKIEREIMSLEIKREALKRENDEARLKGLSEEIANLTDQRNQLRARWQAEKEVVEGIQQKKQEIENLKQEADQAERAGDYGLVAEIRYGRIKEAETKLAELNTKLHETQEGSRLVKEEVDAEDIASVVSRWTGIPVTRMFQSEREKLLHLEDELHK
eukprot:gene65628-89777_t